MKLRDIISESNTDQISKYGKPGAGFEPINSEADEYAGKNKERYRKLFRDFYKTGEMFVYDTEDHVPKKPKFTNAPRDDDRKSAGYRGNQVAKRRSGLSYDKDIFDN